MKKTIVPGFIYEPQANEIDNLPLLNTGAVVAKNNKGDKFIRRKKPLIASLVAFLLCLAALFCIYISGNNVALLNLVAVITATCGYIISVKSSVYLNENGHSTIFKAILFMAILINCLLVSAAIAMAF